MKSVLTRSVAVLAMGACLAVAVPATAFAGGGDQTTTTTALSPSTDHSNKTYGQQLVAYNRAVVIINRTFQSAVAAAQKAFASATLSSRDSMDRVTARAEYRLALASATSDREAALKALGNLPSKRQH